MSGDVRQAVVGGSIDDALRAFLDAIVMRPPVDAAAEHHEPTTTARRSVVDALVLRARPAAPAPVPVVLPDPR